MIGQGTCHTKEERTEAKIFAMETNMEVMNIRERIMLPGSHTLTRRSKSRVDRTIISNPSTNDINISHGGQSSSMEIEIPEGSQNVYIVNYNCNVPNNYKLRNVKRQT